MIIKFRPHPLTPVNSDWIQKEALESCVKANITDRVNFDKQAHAKRLNELQRSSKYFFFNFLIGYHRQGFRPVDYSKTILNHWSFLRPQERHLLGMCKDKAWREIPNLQPLKSSTAWKGNVCWVAICFITTVDPDPSDLPWPFSNVPSKSTLTRSSVWPWALWTCKF